MGLCFTTSISPLSSVPQTFPSIPSYSSLVLILTTAPESLLRVIAMYPLSSIQGGASTGSGRFRTMQKAPPVPCVYRVFEPWRTKAVSTACPRDFPITRDCHSDKSSKTPSILSVGSKLPRQPRTPQGLKSFALDIRFCSISIYHNGAAFATSILRLYSLTVR